MPTFTGTDASEVLTGTDGDDIFYSSKGEDDFIGGAGYDKAIIDYSAIAGTQGVGQYIGYDSFWGGLYGSFRAYDGFTSVETRGVEELDVKTGAMNDSFYVDLTQVPAGWAITLDGGAGSDSVTLKMYNGSPGLIGTVVGGTFTGGGLTLRNFEQFDLELSGGNDQLTLGSGNDTVEAAGGDDYIDGASGDDVIEGGLDADTLIGGDGNDRLYSLGSYGFDNGLEHDVLSGGNGNDLISVGYGDDADGGAGTDKLSLELRYGTGGVVLDLATLFSGGTIVVGGGTIKGFEGYDTIYATEFDDTIIVGNTNNVAQPLASGIQGFGGNDTITSGTGGDVVNGGTGNDVIYSGGGDDRISGDEDNDQVYGEAGNDTLWGGDGDDQVLGGDGNDNILGGFGADNIWGDAGDDVLDGEAGDDAIYGGAGKDILAGGWGTDRLEGGADDDIYMVDATDTIVEMAGGGSDEVRTSEASYSLAGNDQVENLTGTGFVDQILAGNAANNRIDGGLGVDRLEGGLGDDLYLVDAAGDRVIEYASAGIDAVISTANSYALLGLASNVENLTLGGFGLIGAYGNALANIMTGNEFANWLQSGAGGDTVSGLGGDDFLDGGEDADIINGGEGSDWIAGGAGNDVLTGGAYGDIFYFGSALSANVDQITDFALGDGIYLDTSVFSALTAGPLAATAFRQGSAATTSAQRIIYNSSTGQISYDADGNGVGAAILFATVTAGTALTAASFIVGTEGPYEVESSESYLLASAELNLLLTGANAIDGSGNELDNSLTGNAGANWLDGGSGNDTILAGAASDTVTGGAGTDTLTGGAGADTFLDTKAGLSGDTITDLSIGDTIILTDASLAGFTFSLSGSTLTYTGGSLTLTGGVSGALVASAASGGGVQLTVQANVAINDVRNDFNGDGRSDILWRNVDGQLSNWLGQANGGFVANNANAAAVVPTAWFVAGTGDFNGDGRDDILWRNVDGQMSNWLGTANGGFTPNNANAAAVVPTAWNVVGTGDFNGDGRDDILWRNNDGTLSNWLGTAAGGFTPNDANAARFVPTAWFVAGTGDYNGDGRDDILWRNVDGQLSNWLGLANGGFTPNNANAAAVVPTAWVIVGTGDFNGDGRDDILWRNTNGTLSNWLGTAAGGFTPNDANAAVFVPTAWQVVATGDYNGDGRDDILWRHTDGTLSDWLGTAAGGFVANDANAATPVPTVWYVQPEPFLL